MNSVVFTLSADETVVFAASDPLNKKVKTIVVSNETDDTPLDYTITWSIGPQVLYSGTVEPEVADSLLDGVYFMQEAGVEMTAAASGSGLTLFIVYEDVIE